MMGSLCFVLSAVAILFLTSVVNCEVDCNKIDSNGKPEGSYGSGESIE